MTSEPSEDYPLPEGWIKCLSTSMRGKFYYFNTLTAESLWEHPEKAMMEEKAIEKNAISRTPETIRVPEKIIKIAKKTPKQASLNPLPRGKAIKEEKSPLKPLLKTIRTKKIVRNIRKIESNGDITSHQKKLDRVKIESIKRHVVQEGSSGSVGRAAQGKRQHTELCTSPTGPFPAKKADDINKGKTARVSVNNTYHHNSIQAVSKKGAGDIKTKISEPKRDIKIKRIEKTASTKSLPSLKPLRKTINHRVISKMVEFPASGRGSGHKVPIRGTNSSLQKLPYAASQAKSPVIQSNVKCAQNGGGKKAFLVDSSRGPNFTIPYRGFQNTQAFDTISERSSSVWSGSGNADNDQFAVDAEEPCEAMEVDDVEFMERRILKEIEDVRIEKISKPAKSIASGEPVKVLEGALYIILDTNILLSHLKFVSELKDFPIPGAGRPILVIPWMVVQELDRLKAAPDSRVHKSNEDNEQSEIGVNLLARKAVAFLHSCFSQSHPRVRGQTVIEASKSIPGLVEETNDDSILSCCLLYQNKAESFKTVLLSNDRNLCNKAIVNGVKAFTKKNLINGLRDFFQSGSIVVSRDHFKDYFEEAGIQEALADRRRKADDLICELQCILREAFAAAIEHEMKEAYDDIWLQIVKIKPPWTLMDTLQLLDRHWIAVFGQVIKRNAKNLILELKKKFACEDAASRSLSRASEIIELGLSMCHALSSHSDYNGVMPKCLAAVTVLRKRCSECISDASPALINKQKQQCEDNRSHIQSLPEPSSLKEHYEMSESVTNVLHNDDAGEETTNDQALVVPHFVVMSSFDEIWKAVTHLSGSIFDALEYPNPFGNQNDDAHAHPSKEEALRFLTHFTQCLARLVQSIQRVLACPPQSSANDVDLFNDLGESIALFMKTVICQDCTITLDQLRSFCLDNQTRAALVKGLSQLDRALAMLQHCLTCNLR